MGRTFMAAVLVLMLAACSTSSGRSGAASASDQPSPSAQPSGEPDPTTSAPVLPDEHPATGLAVVLFPENPDDPASQVFVVEDDGSLRQVTGLGAGSIGASHPVWSPDRTQIAFGPPKVGFPGVEGQVSVVNADGTDERVLSLGEVPRWSPDGTRLLVAEVDDVTSEPRSTWIIDVASGELTDLGPGFNAQWLGDGDRIAIRRVLETVDGSYADALYVMTLGTRETDELATPPESETVWSPDGSAMLITHDRKIALAAADGSVPRDLVNGFAPVWSPDGTRVLFAYDHDQDATPILALVDLEGQTIWSGMPGTTPTWSPDGTRIAVEIPYPEPSVQVLDAATGEVLWEIAGTQPAWDS